ncbi:MAG: LCP family protein [Eubacteriales bacterium]
MRKRVSPLKFISLLLVFAVSFFAGKFIADWGIIGRPQHTGNTALQTGAELPVNRLNVLLLGVDARPGEKDARTDSIILISIDRDTKKIAMVSIPRDTMVEIEGHGTNKINAANVFGGAELARQTVENLLGVEIPYYIKTNFNGFKEIIDTLGGVDIDVEKRMYYPSENINLKAGLQRLDGYNALGYVRFRHDALGDIGRTERQQKFLSALAKEMLRARTIIKAPVLIPKLMDAVETNLGAGDAILVARAASNLDSNNIITATLPGTFYNYKGASYWKIDESKAKIVLNELFEGMKLATISGPDINVPADKPVGKKTKQNPVTTQDPNAKPAEQPVDGIEGQSPESQYGTYPGQGSSGELNSDQVYPGNPELPPDADPSQTGQYPGQDQNGQNPAGQTPDGQPPSGQIPVELNSGKKTGSSPTANPGTTSGQTGSAGTTSVSNPGSVVVIQG